MTGQGRYPQEVREGHPDGVDFDEDLGGARPGLRQLAEDQDVTGFAVAAQDPGTHAASLSPAGPVGKDVDVLLTDA